MIDITELTDEQLRSMSVEQLKELQKEAENKEVFYDTQQMTQKILLNSLYGALGNQHFVLFNNEIASAITGNGRFTNKTMATTTDKMLGEKIPSKNGYLRYGDTDSFYLSIKPYVDAKESKSGTMTKEEKIDFCDSVCEKVIQPFVNNMTDEIGNILNIYEQGSMAMDREIIADSGIFIAKKRYIARVLDTEGVRLKEPKKKVMGLEIVRSSTPTFCRKYLKDSIDILLDGTETDLIDWVEDIKQKFMEAPIEDISRVTGVNKVSFDLWTPSGRKDSETQKPIYVPLVDQDGERGPITSAYSAFAGKSVKEIGYALFRYQLYLRSEGGVNPFSPIPINTRASLVHNMAIMVNGIERDYTPIEEKSKIKYCLLKTPNPLNSEVFAYMNPSIIETLGLSQYIDKEAMWDRFFIQALEIMIESLKWSHKRKITLDEWF